MNHKELLNNVIDEVSKSFIGKKEIVQDSILALLSGLHILIEDISGVGKTTLVKSIAKVTGLDMGRIQFTPDLLPGDITGMTVWDPVKREFVLKKGVIFNEFIMGDEINRASPRTQSALLEAMEELHVTIDGKSYSLEEPFVVIATKNPSYYIGTFDLPESQLDRFAIYLKPGYPNKEYEMQILEQFKDKNATDIIKQIIDRNQIMAIKEDILSITIPEAVMGYIVDLGNKTRMNDDIKYGISTRGLKHLLTFAQCQAYYNDRSFIIPEDVIYSAYRVFPHKLQLSNEALLNSKNTLEVIGSLIKNLDVPVGIK